MAIAKVACQIIKMFHLCHASGDPHGRELPIQAHQVASAADLPAAAPYEGGGEVLLQLHQLFLCSQ